MVFPQAENIHDYSWRLENNLDIVLYLFDKYFLSSFTFIKHLFNFEYF